MHLEFLGIQIPDEGSADVTNSPASIEAQSSVCRGLYGRVPNVVLVNLPTAALYEKRTCCVC